MRTAKVYIAQIANTLLSICTRQRARRRSTRLRMNVYCIVMRPWTRSHASYSWSGPLRKYTHSTPCLSRETSQD